MPETDFNAYTENYRELHTKNLAITGADSYYFAAQKAQMIRELETGKERLEFLDLGCGDGQCIRFLNGQFPGSRFTGVDTSGMSIEKASGLHLADTEFLQADAAQLPFQDNRFDCLLMACVLHHMEPGKQALLLSEAYRVCKPGGRLYIFEHNPWNPVTRYLVRTCPFDQGVTLLRASKLASLLKGAGFRISQKRFYLFFPPSPFFSFLRGTEKLLRYVPLGGQYLAVGIK